MNLPGKLFKPVKGPLRPFDPDSPNHGDQADPIYHPEPQSESHWKLLLFGGAAIAAAGLFVATGGASGLFTLEGLGLVAEAETIEMSSFALGMAELDALTTTLANRALWAVEDVFAPVGRYLGGLFL